MLGFAKKAIKTIVSGAALTGALGASGSVGAEPPRVTPQVPSQVPRDDAWIRTQLQEARARVDSLQDELRRIQVGVKLTETQFQAPAKADFTILDAMSSAFLLTSVKVWMDDALVYAHDDESAALGLLREVHLLTGPIAAGDHLARIAVQLRGNGAVLPYMRAYRFELSSSHKFAAALGRTTTVSVRACERSDGATPYVHLPALEWL